MPQGEKYWNPYRLIPVRDKVERKTPLTDERFHGKSGIVQCTLENLTPLFIGAQSHGVLHPPLLRNGKRVIPGSSFKGMLRSLAEIVGGGCFVISNDRGTGKIPKSPIPQDMGACSRVNRLCIACRMFGAMERVSNARVHKGKVSIGDGLVQEERLQTKSLQVLLANNGVRHEPFYRSQQSDALDGKSRKLYFHQPKRLDSMRPIESSIRDRAWDIDAMLPGHHFDFDVQFNNLTDHEFSLLLYILNLEDQLEVVIGDEKIKLSGPMRHKIGNAKPLGMGSCHIKVNRLTILAPPAERFRSMSVESDQVLEGDALHQEIERRIQPYVADTSPTMQALRKMMVWDENDPREFHYPGYPWFQSSGNKNTPLKNL